MKLINRIKTFRHNIYIWKFCHMKIQKNKIILWSDSFKHFGCSPKYIALYLLKKYPGKFDIVWVLENGIEIPKDMPNEIRIVRYFSIDYLKELHTAKFVICNMRTGDAYFWHKRAEQIYIQTWHGYLALKMIEKDAGELLPQEYIQNAINDSKKIDLLLTGCEFSTEMFKRCFWYDGPILKGLPRCDILLKGETQVKEKVYEYYQIPKDKKLLLYAPTFRNGNKANVYEMNFPLIESELKKINSDSWGIGCRLHPNIREEVSDKFCISMSDYPDMQELLAAADVLITDYSSTMFEMALCKKICILYAPDIEDYLLNERKMYFDIKKLPFPLATDMEQLCLIFRNFDKKIYDNKTKKFIEKIGNYETGNSTEKLANYILDKM